MPGLGWLASNNLEGTPANAQVLFPNVGAWNWENSGGRKRLTSHQEPDGRPRDPVGVADYALVPPTVTGGDAADLQGQVGQLRDSAC